MDKMSSFVFGVARCRDLGSNHAHAQIFWLRGLWRGVATSGPTVP
jgi:hypothetical protein